MKATIIMSLAFTLMLGFSCSQSDNEMTDPSNLFDQDALNSMSNPLITCEEEFVVEALDCGPGEFGSRQYEVTNCYRGRRPSGRGGILVSSDTVLITTIPCHTIELPRF